MKVKVKSNLREVLSCFILGSSGGGGGRPTALGASLGTASNCGGGAGGRMVPCNTI